MSFGSLAILVNKEGPKFLMWNFGIQVVCTIPLFFIYIHELNRQECNNLTIMSV